MVKNFRRVLVANRGEIALRVIRALKLLAVESVAVYSDADSGALHTREADLAYNLRGVYPNETYLDSEKIVEIARKADCDAIHPGYGFLSENAEFCRLCERNSIKFIGPSASTLTLSGNKLECKKLVESKGIPVIPYTKEPIEDAGQAARLASEIGFPVLLKSAFGGGGRGIREAGSKEDVRQAFESSEREARAAFGRFAVFLEKKLIKPRHIEFQILANDNSSEFVHLGERECSIQRRYQKLVELSPSPVVDEETRKRIASYAIEAAKAVKYSNAGTVEFLRDSESGNFYFIEINSRLQVEHPVTEIVTSLDLVQSQVEIASGKSLPIKQSELKIVGCAIECRINAEDPLLDFAPVSGVLESFNLPGGPGVRVDTAIFPQLEISPFYDSLIAKLITWGRSFEEARRRMVVALREFHITGVGTTVKFQRQVMEDDSFKRRELSTSFIEETKIIERLIEQERKRKLADDNFLLAALLAQRQRSHKFAGEIRPAPIRAGGSFIPWDQTRGRFIDGY